MVKYLCWSRWPRSPFHGPDVSTEVPLPQWTRLTRSSPGSRPAPAGRQTLSRGQTFSPAAGRGAGCPTESSLWDDRLLQRDGSYGTNFRHRGQHDGKIFFGGGVTVWEYFGCTSRWSSSSTLAPCLTVNKQAPALDLKLSSPQPTRGFHLLHF